MSLLTAALTLFLVLDPLGNLPVVMSVLRTVPPARRVFILARELIIALLIMFGFLFAGQAVLNALGLDPAAISIAGGVILFLIALRMIFPVPGGIMSMRGDEEPLIVPLATPMIAGPSVLAILLLMSNQSPELMGRWALAVFLAWLGTAIILMLAPKLEVWLGTRVIQALERLMGMVLIILAVQMLLDGLAAYLHQLGTLAL